MILTASINLSKIDKSKLAKGKNGNLWLNFDIFVSDSPDRLGNDAALAYRQTREERESRQKRIYIGNGKVVHGKIPDYLQKAIAKDNDILNVADDLPF